MPRQPACGLHRDVDDADIDTASDTPSADVVNVHARLAKLWSYYGYSTTTIHATMVRRRPPVASEFAGAARGTTALLRLGGFSLGSSAWLLPGGATARP
jgi:hypothetical protein